MPWLRSRRSLRFIVGDQHNSTSTTREKGFGPRKHGALTGLAQRASQPSGGSLTSNREASPSSPPTTLDGKQPWTLADDEVWLGMTHLVLTRGDAYLFWPPRRVQRWGSLAEQPLPASSLTRNSRISW